MFDHLLAEALASGSYPVLRIGQGFSELVDESMVMMIGIGKTLTPRDETNSQCRERDK